MSINLPLLAALATLGAVIVAMVDGRRAVTIAAVAATLTLAPLAAAVGGPVAGLALLGVGVASVLAESAARLLGRHLRWLDGLDPLVPIFAPPQALFGPRSVRAAGAALLLPAASWVSFNIPVGVQASVAGLLFPAAYICLCGTLRVFLARTAEDAGVGFTAVGIAVATAWILRGGSNAVLEAMIPAALALGVASVIGWLGGRHARRVTAVMTE